MANKVDSFDASDDAFDTSGLDEELPLAVEVTDDDPSDDDDDTAEAEVLAELAAIEDAEEELELVEYSRGDLFQIIVEIPGKEGWLGAIIMARDIGAEGITGWLHEIVNDEVCQARLIRVKFKNLSYVGTADIQPVREFDDIELVWPKKR